MQSLANFVSGETQRDVVELSIGEMKSMLASGRITSTELVVNYLNRLFFYDVNGIRLNSTPIIASNALHEAMQKDSQRAHGNVQGSLQGIPFTVKDSYMAKGMTMAAGSPAFAHVVANEDSFSVAALRKAGAILLGRTNMPPMAAGGVQRGVYGRSESPYNGEYLPAAWYSGSSHGSAVSTAASFAAFGMGEETVSSGRSPAANNGVVAYTPTRGVISLRGNWVLHATKDEVVPHARTVEDLLQLLPTLTQADEDTRGDLWRRQPFVPLDDAARVQDLGFEGVMGADVLSGLNIGVVNEYAGRLGGVIPSVYTRPSINALLMQSMQSLRQLGAHVRWTSLPLRDAYESAPRTLKTFADEGLIPHDWMEHEWLQLNASILEEFIESFDMSGITSLQDVDPDDIFPNPFNSVAHAKHYRYGFYQQADEYMRSGAMLPSEETPELEQGLRGLEAIRKRHLEAWMRAENLDVLIFPTNSNVAKADTDVDEVDNTEAWQDGTWFSNGNRFIRHLGIPTVTTTMGVMSDTGMPAGLTFIGPSGSDQLLLACAYEFEQSTSLRVPPKRTPPLPDHGRIPLNGSFAQSQPGQSDGGPLDATLDVTIEHGSIDYDVRMSNPDQRYSCRIFINGVLVQEWSRDDSWHGTLSLASVFDARKVAVIALFSSLDRSLGADIRVCDNPVPTHGEGSLL
ncbi:MAG: amidase [Bifidobacterium sp.]|uniref:Amidase n=2 Tax=Bifidobacterium aquikefiricola TaxID=3059038 RepID=A0AB39U5B7_9BIFI